MIMNKKKYSCKFSQKSIVNHFFLIEMKIIHICNFLDIDCYENLQEYFFVWNQFLIIKIKEKYAKILSLFNILAFFFIFYY